ncbi:hypothetical protein LXL04_006498 [Taraxacum kok-saghyz]
MTLLPTASQIDVNHPSGLDWTTEVCRSSIKFTSEGTRVMQVCCTKDLNSITNITTNDEFLRRKSGDLRIMYAIIRTYESNYWTEVTIKNHNSLGRLDNWNLTWDWMRDEFINDIKGAYPYTRDSSPCIFGPQGTFYQQMDFSVVLNCKRSPTLIDLPLEMTNNTQRGKKFPSQSP